MKNEVKIHALPAIELIIALPESYPSHFKPMLIQTQQFYSDYGNYQEFMIEQINGKWSEEMPVLYEIAIYLQDDFLTSFFEQAGMEPPVDNLVSFECKDA